MPHPRAESYPGAFYGPLHHEAPAFNRAPSKAEKRSRFTLKNIILNGLLISVLFFLNAAGTPGSALCYAVLFWMAWRSTEGAIKAVSLSSIIIVANPFLIDINMVHTYLRFPLIAVGGARIFLEAYRRAPRAFFQAHLVGLLVFGLVALICAFINQYFFMISFLKLGVFIYGAYAIMLATDMQRFSGSDLTVWFAAMVLFYIGGNAIAYVAGVGYTFRGRLLDEGMGLGFAGMSNHPQTQGPLSAISFVYALCIFLYTPYRMRWLMILTAPVLLVYCYMSAARTGLFALMIAVGIILVLTFLFSGGPRRVRLNVSVPQLVVLLVFGVCGLVIVEILSGGAITQKFTDFALKTIRGGGSPFGDELTFARIFQSRMPVIEASLRAFEQSPWTGIGFGTMLDARWAAQASIFTAPTEKGFLPTAILEETGIFGTLAFIVFLVLFYTHFWKMRNIVALAVMSCFLLLNLGEMMFFALGGMGLYCWSILGAAIALGNRVVASGPPRAG